MHMLKVDVVVSVHYLLLWSLEAVVLLFGYKSHFMYLCVILWFWDQKLVSKVCVERDLLRSKHCSNFSFCYLMDWFHH